MAQDVPARTDTAQAERRHGSRDWFRAAALWLCAVIGCLALAAYVVIRWAEHQILNTDSWVALMAPLPKQPQVADSLGSFVSQQVFDAGKVQARVADVLPPRADFLAAPLTAQLNTLTTKTAQRIMASDAFQSIWTGANRLAMGRLLAVSRGQTPPLQARVNQRFDINLSDMRGSLRASLGKVSDALPALQPGAKKALDVSADLRERPKRLQQIVQTADSLYSVLPYAVAAGILSALAFARRRLRTVAMLATAAIVLFLIELIALNWLRGYVLDQVRNPANTGAATVIFDTITGDLRNSVGTAIIAMLIILIISLLAGPFAWARKFRSWISLDKLAQTRVGVWWRTARTRTGQWKYFIWLGAAIIVFAAMAASGHVSGHGVLNAALLIIALWALVYMFGSPRNRESSSIPAEA